jgi:hypothetical protein
MVMVVKLVLHGDLGFQCYGILYLERGKIIGPKKGEVVEEIESMSER